MQNGKVLLQQKVSIGSWQCTVGNVKPHKTVDIAVVLSDFLLLWAEQPRPKIFSSQVLKPRYLNLENHPSTTSITPIFQFISKSDFLQIEIVTFSRPA